MSTGKAIETLLGPKDQVFFARIKKVDRGWKAAPTAYS
jgi:hypothetical protein